jgi:lipoprotein-anchoring transpeptidase ErfK/SrfK
MPPKRPGISRLTALRRSPDRIKSRRTRFTMTTVRGHPTGEGFAMLSRRLVLTGFGASLLGGCVAARAPESEASPGLLVPLTRERFRVAAVDLGEIPPQYHRQIVEDPTGERPGTVVVDPDARFLYLVLRDRMALRYGVGVGRQGFTWSGAATVARKAAWPRWTPPPEMVARDRLARRWAAGMPGRADNPLGARALYLYQNGRDTLYRIHGTAEVWSIGRAVSSGCIRLLNADIIDLYNQVPTGTRVVVRRSRGPIADPLEEPEES